MPSGRSRVGSESPARLQVRLLGPKGYLLSQAHREEEDASDPDDED